MKALLWFIVLALLAGGGAYYYMSAQKTTTEKPYVVEPRQIHRAIHGSGLVEGSSAIMRLKYAVPGILDEVNFKEGEFVKGNDIVARLNTTDIDSKIKLEESALKEHTAKRDALKARKNSEAVANVEWELRREQDEVRRLESRLQELKTPIVAEKKREDLEAATRAVDRGRQRLALAEAEWKLLKSRPSADELAVAGARLEAAKLRNDDAKRTGQAAEAVAAAELRYALADYDKIKRGASPEELDAAAQRISMARTEFEQADEEQKRLNAPRPPAPAPLALIAETEKALADAKARTDGKRQELDRLRKDAEAADLLAAEAAIEASTERLKMLKNMKLGYDLRAPFDALVTKRLVEAGALLAPYEDVLWVVDFARKRVRAEFDIMALPSLNENLKAKVKSRAFGKEELSAHVIAIRNARPRGLLGDDPSISKGGEVIEVLLEIDKPDEPAKREIYDKLLRPGLRAEVDIVMESTEKAVVCVPNSYVATKKGVQYVMQTGQNPKTGKIEKPRRKDVICGLRDEYYVEIKEGLKADDLILKPDAEGR